MERPNPENSFPQERTIQPLEIGPDELSNPETAQQLYEKFKQAEESARTQNPQAAEAEVLRSVREYGAQAGASAELLSSVDDETGFKRRLAEIRKQEESIVDRFREKLRKLAGPLAGLAMMSPTVADAALPVEAPSVYGQLDREKPSSAPHEWTKSAETEVFGVDQADREGGETIPSEGLPHELEGEQGLGETLPLSEKEQQAIDQESRRREAMQAFESRFREQEFSNEGEVLSSFQESAREQENEFLAIYVVKPNGRVEIVSGEFVGKSGGMTWDRNEQIKKLRTQNQKIVLAHTHPISSAEFMGLEKSHELAFRRMPPSLVDIRAASELSWLDRYDNPSQHEGIDGTAKFSDPTEAVVVDGEGVWRYRVDFSHPYLQEQRNAAVEEAVELNAVQRKKNSAVETEKARDFYSQIVIPDETINRRLFKNAPGRVKMDVTSMLHARMVGVGSQEGFGYEYSNEQVKVGNAKPEEKEKVTEEFIQWCRERGIEMTFTPFSQYK